MKKMVFIVCFFSFIMIAGSVGCRDTQSGGKARLSKLDQDALDMAKTLYFSKRIIRCGDFTYTSLSNTLMSGQNLRRVKDTGTFTVKSRNLSEADKMNGIEWRGWVTFTAKGPCQERWTGLGPPHGSYGQWMDNAIYEEIPLEKANAGWRIIGIQGDLPVDQLSCEQATR